MLAVEDFSLFMLGLLGCLKAVLNRVYLLSKSNISFHIFFSFVVF